MSTLGLIPARGGSKGIPRKNLATLGGKPLIAWTIESSLRCQRLDRLVVSTDCDEIAEVARKLGAEVPFRRPPELATDTAGALQVMAHALRATEESHGATYDALVYLQPTSPFRSADRITQAVELLDAGDVDTIVSVVRVPHNMTPGSLMTPVDCYIRFSAPSEERRFRRQEKPLLYARNGPAILALSRDCLLRQKRLYGKRIKPLVMESLESIDIDQPHDLILAEALLPLATKSFR